MDVLWGRRGTAINHISVLSAAATPEYWKWLRQRRVPIFLLISRLSLIWSISRTVWVSYSLASSYLLLFFFRCCFSCCCGWQNPPGARNALLGSPLLVQMYSSVDLFVPAFSPSAESTDLQFCVVSAFWSRSANVSHMAVQLPPAFTSAGFRFASR